MESIGERIKYIRKIHKLNQQQFSKAVDISQGRLSEIEKDKCKPSAETLISISQIFNVNLNWLLLGEGLYDKSLDANQFAFFFSQLTEDDQTEVITYISSKKDKNELRG